MTPEINPCILRLSMLYLKEEETEASDDTVPPQRGPAQHVLTCLVLLSCSVEWVLGLSLLKKLKHRG